MKALFIATTLLLSSLNATAQEEAPNFETVVEDVIFNTSSRVILDEKTIRDSRALSVPSLLSTQANITITSTPVQPNSIYIRGGDSSHVLIIIDGVPYYDSSTSQRTFNLTNLDIRSVRRIEIIKGSQTVLYGGQALSGVIKIDTIPQNFERKASVQAEAGTPNSIGGSVFIAQPLTENQMVLLRGHSESAETNSPVLDSSKKYDRTNSNGEVTYAWRGPAEGYVKASYFQEKFDAPSFNPVNYRVVDINGFDQSSQHIGASTRVALKELPWSPTLGFVANNSQRNFDHPTAPAIFQTLTEDQYGSNLRNVRLDLFPVKSEMFDVTTGLSYNYEDFYYRSFGAEQRNQFSEQRGLYLKADTKFGDGFILSLGGRVENWDDRDDVGTYQAGLTMFKNTKIEVSSGYKIPSLFQLYSNQYGNINLKEENSIQYSLTQDVNISERQNLSATFFVANFSNLIIIQGTGPGTLRYNNVARAESRGVELTYSLRPTESSSLLVSYGYQEPKDLSNGRWLQRRPLVNGSVRYSQYWSAHTGTLEIQGAGERVEKNGNGPNAFTTIPGYAIANAAYSYQFGNGFGAYARLNNLLDYRYQESYTYYSQGFNGVLGAEYTF